MKRSLFFSFFLFIPFFAYSQSSFYKEIDVVDIADGQYINNIGILPSGDLLWSGELHADTTAYQHLLFFRTDTLGNVRWAKSGPTTAYFVNGISSDSTHLYIGGSHAFSIFVMKSDTAMGNVAWIKTVLPINASYRTPVFKMFPLNGGMLLAGAMAPIINSPVDNRVFALQLDSSGNVVWSKVYGVPGNHFRFETAAMDSAGTLIISADLDNTGGCLLKLDSVGNISWSLAYPPGTNGVQFSSILPLENGYLLGGTAAPVANVNWRSTALVRIDSAGQVMWFHRMEEDTDAIGNVLGMTFEPNGRLMLACNGYSNGYNPVVNYIEYDTAAGVPLAAWTIGTMRQVNFSTGFTPFEGRYYVGGMSTYTTSFNRAVLIGFDPRNPTTCETDTLVFTDTPDTLSPQPLILVDSAGSQVINRNPLVFQPVNLTEYPCTWLGIEEPAAENEIGVFPNPSNGNVQIDLGKSHEGVRMRLYDVNGKMIREENAGNVKSFQLQRNGMTAGIYFLEISGEDGFFATKKILFAD